MKKTRVGIVGCGGIANAHQSAYRADGKVEIVSVYDPRAQAAETMAERTGGRVAASVAEMAGKDKLDAVSICSPPAAHLDNCRPFLKAKVAVLCEKPLEVNAARAARLAKLAKETRARFMVAFCHRFHPAVIELKKLIKSGILGRPVLFRNIFGGYLPLKGNHRTNPALSGGGPLIDHCCHSVDLFRFLVGDPTEVQAMAVNAVQHESIEDLGIMQLDRGGRTLGDIIGSYSLTASGNWVEWYGTKGRATVSYWNAGHPDLAYRLKEGDWQPVDCSKHPDRFAAEIGHFLNCVRNRRKPSITAEDGLKANKIIARAYKSVSTGRRTTLSL